MVSALDTAEVVAGQAAVQVPGISVSQRVAIGVLTSRGSRNKLSVVEGSTGLTITIGAVEVCWPEINAFLVVTNP